MCDVGSALTDITLQNYKKNVTIATLCCDPVAGTAAMRKIYWKVLQYVYARTLCNMTTVACIQYSGVGSLLVVL